MPELNNDNPAPAGNDIADLMGGMQGAEPTKEPAENGGDNSAGNKPNADGNTGGKGTQQNPAWFSQIGDITKDTGAAEKLAKFEKLGDLAKSYLELEGKLGSSIVKPGENASDEEIEAFYRKLGKPETADKYSISGDEAKMFREMAFKNNLTDDQAKALYQSLQEVGQTALAQQKAVFAVQAQETQAALKKEFGKDYPAKIELLKRGIATYGGQNMGAKLQAAGLLGDYDVVKLFINLGQISAEAGSSGKNNGKTDDYKSIGEGGTFSFYKDTK